ncbi:MAG TPA: S8 family serine peptidase, partial [Phycisphaerales bacterium]|nr:S8 family serine peptidase [Phycisphaerales bacterium]
MTTSRLASILLVCGTIGSASLAGPIERPSTSTAPQPRYVEKIGELEFSGQLIVRPARGLTDQQRAQALARIHDITLKHYHEVDEFVVLATASNALGSRGVAENALSDELMATGLFQYAVPNWICYPVATPNDPIFPSQWHHQNMQSELGWNISTGIPSIITAYTDTGIDLTHPDLAAKRVPGFDAPNDLAEVDGGSVAELHGHGTHVAGCGAAISDNGIGVAGVNWQARIMMIRVAFDSSGGAYYDDLLQGARWAIENGAKTVSASYSGIAFEPIQTTGAYIKSIGGLYFYAAGNDSANLNWFDWPDVIVVGASDSGDNRAWFSAYGPAVDVFAPGDGIWAPTWGGGYAAWSGTSMATPVANGVASLIWSINPNLTPDQVEQILFTSCDDLGAPGNDDFYGWGRVNVYKAALAAAATTGPTPPTANDDNVSFAIFGEPKTVDVLANDYDLNGDPITIIAFDAATTQGGSVSLSMGTGPGGRDQLVYNAPSSYVGQDTFQYTITDGISAYA